MQQNQIFLIIGFIFLGVFFSAIYYLARYFFRASDEDKEVFPFLGKESSQAQSKKLNQALSQTKMHFWGRIQSQFSSKFISSEDLESLEELLYTSDLGTKTVQRLLLAVKEKIPSSGESLQNAAGEPTNLDKVRQVLRGEMLHIFSQQKEVTQIENYFESSSLQAWMIVGVNGSGKTTSIGKLAYKAALMGKKTMVIAGDTFRAAADSQLQVWSERAKVDIFRSEKATNPSAVVFEGLSQAQAQNYDLVIVDTAGRLHTQSHLMDELKKMKRVMAKIIPETPQEVFIVLDANSGQNALTQAKVFHENLGLTGVILTKLDGSSKGGVALSLGCELDLPIKMIGVGEASEDLKAFSSVDFVDSII